MMDAESITLDTSLIARLGHLDRELEFRDEEGKTLGFYSPAVPSRYVPPHRAPEVYAWIRRQSTEAELLRILQEPDVGSTADVLNRITTG
jgi:hypothetical protein